MDLSETTLANDLSLTDRARENVDPGVTSAIPSSAKENRDCACWYLKSLNLDNRSMSSTFHTSTWFNNANADAVSKVRHWCQSPIIRRNKIAPALDVYLSPRLYSTYRMRDLCTQVGHVNSMNDGMVVFPRL